MSLKGVQLAVNEDGEKTAVVIDLKRHGRLWEDLYDAMLAEQRRHEPRESLDQVKRRLAAQKKSHRDA